MNEQIESFARNTLKQGLMECTEGQQLLFKRMYAHGNLEMPINDVVDSMETEKLDWAMQQVQRTLDKNSREQALENHKVDKIHSESLLTGINYHRGEYKDPGMIKGGG